MKLSQLSRTVLLSRFATHPHFLPRLAMFIVVTLVLTCGAAMAQPTLVIDDASIFEGNSGTSILKLPVRFVGAQPNQVTGQVSVIPLQGSGFNPATPGATCTGSTDYIPFTNAAFTIPPNTPNGTLSVNMTVCGDATIEPDEQVFVFFSNVVGADCSGEGNCNGVGTIINDDGPPSITTRNISVSTLNGLSRTVSFTVTLHHPFSSTVSVHFATRDGTAHAQTTTNIGAYFGTNGTLSFPPNVTSETIPVTITGHGGGTFFLDLSSPVNGTIGTSTAQATIVIKELTVGAFEIAPDAAEVQVGDRVNFAVTWEVPVGEVWRDLNTIDFRIGKGGQTALLLRWSETANTISLCTVKGNPKNDSDDDSPPVCGPGFAPGSGGVLDTPYATLYLADSSVVGSGPTGTTVTLNLSVAFYKKAANHLYDVELAATDDFSHRDDFTDATTIRVDKLPK